mgnify:CR=1 FL=1
MINQIIPIKELCVENDPLGEFLTIPVGKSREVMVERLFASDSLNWQNLKKSLEYLKTPCRK